MFARPGTIEAWPTDIAQTAHLVFRQETPMHAISLLAAIGLAVAPLIAGATIGLARRRSPMSRKYIESPSGEG
jgi:hypothetical protein